MLGGPVVQHGHGGSPRRQLDPTSIPLEVVLHGHGDAEGGVDGRREEGLDGLREADERVAGAESEFEDRVPVVVPVDDEARALRLQASWMTNFESRRGIRFVGFALPLTKYMI